MNLKYYLRGLGLGIIVTAIILGVHYSRTSTGMSDSEVKKRAAELGMVENTTLVSGDEKTTEELLDELNSDNASESTESETENSDTAQSTDFDTKITDLENAVDGIVQETNELTGEENVPVTDAVDDPGTVSNSKAQDNTDAEVSEASAESDEEVKEPAAEEEVQEAGAEESAAETAAVDSDKIVITINSGDSSYAVAKKLVNAGLVLDASDYDLYLCNNGYDRYIRTGIFEIPNGSSNEAIAKMITGR